MHERTAPFSLFILLVLTAILYWMGLHGPFVLDDLQTIDMAKVPSFHWNAIWQVLFLNDTGPLYRPVSVLSFIFTHAVFGETPFGYKLTNLVVHLLTGIALFLVIQKVVDTLARYTLSLSSKVAFFATALWMLHPLLVSTVLYSVQRMAMLSTFFMLLAFYFYLLHRLDKSPSRLKENLMTSGILISWALAILSKENGILFPFLVFAFELCIPKENEDKSYKTLISWALVSFAVIAAGAWYYWLKFPAFEQSFHAKGFTLGSYILLQSKVLVFYLKSIFLPTLHSLGLYHDDFQKVFICPLWFSLSLLGTLFLSALALLSRCPLMSFGIFWFFIGHGIESSVLPLEPVFEHRNYFSSMGILLALVTLFAEIIQRGFCQKWMPRFMVLFLMLFAILTGLRIENWSTPQNFLLTEKLHHPLSARANIEWANYLFELGDYDQALNTLETAYELNPHNSGPRLHQYLATCFMKDPKPAFYQQAIKSLKENSVTPYSILVLNALVENQMNGKCLRPLTESESIIDSAIENPYLALKPKYVAVLYHLKAGLLVQQKAIPHAIIALDKAYHLNPKRLEPLVEKVQLLIKMHDLQDALITLNYLKIQPGSHLPSIQKKIQTLEAELQ